MWRHATKIADGFKMDSFEPCYDENNLRRYSQDCFPVVGLIVTVGSSVRTEKVTGDVGRGKLTLPLPDSSVG